MRLDGGYALPPHHDGSNPMFWKKAKEVKPIAEGSPTPPRAQELPDSTTPEGTCPRCGFKSSFVVLGQLPLTFHPQWMLAEKTGEEILIPVEQAASLQCRHCKQCLIVVEEQLHNGFRWTERGTGTITWRGVFWWPLPGEILNADVPEPIKSCFAEAKRANAAGCHRASAAMARRALEALCEERGQTQGRLVDRLKALAAAGVLPPPLDDWAKEVRLVGNSGVHFDPIKSVSVEDSAALLTFLRELLRHVYELPAELARRRANKP